MEQNNKYFDDVNRLVDYYQFPSDAPSTIFAKGYNLAFFVSDFLNRLTDETQPKFSQLEECWEFVNFLTLCKGSEITMTGIICTNAFGDIKNTSKIVHFNNWNFLSTLQAIACFEADRLERLFDKNCTQKEETLSANKLLGKYVDELLSYIEGFDFGKISKTKKYSFIYDALRLAGVMAGNTKAAIITDEGFTGVVGSQKNKDVSNWLNAYKKHRKQQKD